MFVALVIFEFKGPYEVDPAETQVAHMASGKLANFAIVAERIYDYASTGKLANADRLERQRHAERPRLTMCRFLVALLVLEAVLVAFVRPSGMSFAKSIPCGAGIRSLGESDICEQMSKQKMIGRPNSASPATTEVATPTTIRTELSTNPLPDPMPNVKTAYATASQSPFPTATIGSISVATFDPGTTEHSLMPVRLTATPPPNSALLAIVATEDANTITPPSSVPWKQCSVASVSSGLRGGNANSPRQYVYYHIVQSGDPTSYTWTSVTAYYNSVELFTIPNVNPYVPFVCEPWAGGNVKQNGTVPIYWNPLIPHYANAYVLASVTGIYGQRGSGNVARPPGSPFSLLTSINPTYARTDTYGYHNPPLSYIQPTAELATSNPTDEAVSNLIVVNPLTRHAHPNTADAHPSIVSGTIHSTVLGANVENRYYGVPLLSLASTAAARIGLTGARWPSGFYGDVTDWHDARPGVKTPYCNYNRAAQDQSATFDNFMKYFAIPNNLSPEINVNYATGQPMTPWISTTCKVGGDPTAATSWVDYSNNVHHYDVKWWEVGNEIWGSRGDGALQPAPNGTPVAYVTYEPAFYRDMKSVDPSIHVGIPVENYSTATRKENWDPIVMAGALYDYVIFHYYPYGDTTPADMALLQAPYGARTGVTWNLNNLRFELQQYSGKCTTFASCVSTVPISVSEWNASGSSGIAQGLTIVGGLFTAETLGEMFNDGVQRAEIYDLASCGSTPRAPVSGLYDWQRAGKYQPGNWGLVNLLPNNDNPRTTVLPACNYGSTGGYITIPQGAILPPGIAFQMYSRSGFATEGASALVVDQPYSDVHVYASWNGATLVFFLINMNPTARRELSLAADGIRGGASRSQLQYTKSMYDQTYGNGYGGRGSWRGAAVSPGGAWTFPYSVSLPPWSMTAISFTVQRGITKPISGRGDRCRG